MIEIELTHNPFLLENKLMIDGQEQDSETCQKICGMPNKELSSWAGEFFEKIEKKYNDSATVVFNGILRDYEFLEDNLSSGQKKGRYNDIILKQGTIVESAERLSKLRELFHEMLQETPFESLKTKELESQFKRVTESEFEMAVVATMSSGKSTLINAMLGRELLPARNEATTATIARIHDCDEMKDRGFKAESYGADGNLLESTDELSLEFMEELNDISKTPTSRIEIHGDISGIDSSQIRLVLTDTPGPNNSRTAEHAKHTMDLLNSEEKPFIIYVLNATQTATNDDNNLLSKVAEMCNKGDRQSRDRFLFILNKADEFDPDKEPLAKVMDKVKTYLKDKGIDEPRIFPASAFLAKRIRQKITNDPALTSKEKRNLNSDIGYFIEEKAMHLSNYAVFLSPRTQKVLDSRLEEARKNNDEEQEALIYSGIPAIELAMEEYLYKYALPRKISEGVETFKRKLDDLNIETKTITELKKNKNAAKTLAEELDRVTEILEKDVVAAKLREKISNLSSKQEVKKILDEKYRNYNKQRNELFKMVPSEQHVTLEEGKKFVQQFEKKFSQIIVELTSDIENALKNIITGQAQNYIDEYNKYLQDVVGTFEYRKTTAAIFGDAANVSVRDILDEYSHQEVVVVGSHREKEEGFWGGIKRFFTFGSKGYKTVIDYGLGSFVDLSSFKRDVLQTEVAKFEKESSDISFSWTEKQEKQLKQAFLKKFDAIEKVIKEKTLEKKELLNNERILTGIIEKKENDLKWIQSFQHKLNELLLVK